MTEWNLWKNNEKTRLFFKKINERRVEIENDLLGGNLLLNTDADLIREYVFNMGFYEALKYVSEDIFKDEEILDDD